MLLGADLYPCNRHTLSRALKELGFSYVSARPKAYKQDPEAIAAFKKTFPPAALARRTSSPIAGPGRAHARVPFTINAPSRPICSARSAPNSVWLPSCNSEAMQRHLARQMARVPRRATLCGAARARPAPRPARASRNDPIYLEEAAAALLLNEGGAPAARAVLSWKLQAATRPAIIRRLARPTRSLGGTPSAAPGLWRLSS